MRDNNLNISDLNLLLDSAEAALRNDDYELFGFIALHELPAFRACGSADIWKNEYIPAIRAHPVYELALQCPFCQRATDKPRGYAGDAVLIDYLYQHEPTISCLEATPAGLGMLNYWATSPAGAAVKYRKNLFRRKISSLPAGARVVSIACGHLRELDSLTSEAEVVGIDQDDDSLDIARASCPSATVIHASIGKLFREELDIGSSQLIYAAGLFDYLNDRTAGALLKLMYDSLIPGGSLVLSNFLPQCPNIASMEAFQDWFLIYRDRDAMSELISGFPGSKYYQMDPFCSIGYYTVVKGAQ